MNRRPQSAAEVAAARRDVSYQLWIVLRQARRIAIGRLGVFDFPAGVYVYTGSAVRNMEARLARHCRKDKTLRWHIDYLLAAEGVELACIGRSAVAECTLNRAGSGRVVVPGFGASDCRKACGSHLRYLGPDLNQDGAPPA